MIRLLLTPLSLSMISPLPSLSSNSPSISLYRPKTSTVENGSASTPSLKHPNLILLFSWTGAQQKHITKYISGYFARFPSTPIMAITTSINDLTYRTSSKSAVPSSPPSPPSHAPQPPTPTSSSTPSPKVAPPPPFTSPKPSSPRLTAASPSPC
jgi:hypothetical protein